MPTSWSVVRAGSTVMEWHPLGHVEDLYTEGDNFNNPVRLIRFDVEEGIVESGADDCSLIRSVYSAFDHNPTRMMRTSVEPLPDHVDVIVGHSLVSSTAAVRLRDQLYPNAKVITTLSLLPVSYTHLTLPTILRV